MIFTGFRKPNEAIVFYGMNDVVRRLPLFLDEVNHSPTGFEWGYSGSGPAQLAYAILRKFTGSDVVARDNYQAFKEAFISPIRGDHWNIDSEQIQEWLDNQK